MAFAELAASGDHGVSLHNRLQVLSRSKSTQGQPTTPLLLLLKLLRAFGSEDLEKMVRDLRMNHHRRRFEQLLLFLDRLALILPARQAT